MTKIERALAKVVTAVWANSVRSAVKYLAEDLVVKATAKGKPDGRYRSRSFVVTIGKPNYRERQFVKACRKAGEPFPVRKLQLRFWKGK